MEFFVVGWGWASSYFEPIDKAIELINLFKARVNAMRVGKSKQARYLEKLNAFATRSAEATKAHFQGITVGSRKVQKLSSVAGLLERITYI